MNIRENIRPGGRSARVQASVHQAVRSLLVAMDRSDVTIPLIAAEAGVTPSTIYRRWGDLQELLADVAVERLRPDAPPKDTGSARTDLMQWAEQYADEMASGPGRAMIRDVPVQRRNRQPQRRKMLRLYPRTAAGHRRPRAGARRRLSGCGDSDRRPWSPRSCTASSLPMHRPPPARYQR